MIKLKPLLKEIERQAFWRTPESTPVAVVDVLHKIMREVLRKSREKKINISDYARVHNLTAGNWMIENRKNKNLLLSYNEKENAWWIYGTKSVLKGEKLKGRRLNSRQLNNIIGHWIS